ncbi:MAG: UDP-3-O-(3-hydroxymyristoyl)glucosamine N-acyltransferase [Pseudomonadota bacterium]
MPAQHGSFALGELARLVDGTVRGDPDRVINGIGSLDSAADDQLSHLSSAGYRHLLESTQAAAVILAEEDLSRWSGDAIVVAKPYLAFARISQCFARKSALAEGIAPGAHVDPSASIDPTAAIAAGASVGARSVLGPRVRVHPGAVVGEDCVLAEDVELMANAVLYSSVQLGARTIIHSSAVIGADGFGFTPDEQGRLVAIAQLGGVRIGADVSVGAATTIDCGALDDTVIEDGVKIDNLCQIGHNSVIGAHTIICGCVGIVGSTRIGRHVVLAGGAGVGGDKPITICDQAVVSACTLITQDITEPGIYSGAVLHSPTRQWKRNALRMLKLDELFRRVARLESSLANKASK